MNNKDNSKNLYNLISKNLFLSYIHYNTALLLDISIPKYIKNLKIEELVKIINCLNSSYFYSMNFNSKIDLRLAISNFMKIDSVVNLYQQFYVSLKNYFFILEYIYYKTDSSELKRKIFEKILYSSEQILNDYLNENNDNDILEKELIERETLLTKCSGPICEFLFPLIDKIQFYNDEKFRDKICDILLRLIMSEKLPIRQKVKDILSNVFQFLNKNPEEI